MCRTGSAGPYQTGAHAALRLLEARPDLTLSDPTRLGHRRRVGRVRRCARRRDDRDVQPHVRPFGGLWLPDSGAAVARLRRVRRDCALHAPAGSRGQRGEILAHMIDVSDERGRVAPAVARRLARGREPRRRTTPRGGRCPAGRTGRSPCQDVLALRLRNGGEHLGDLGHGCSSETTFTDSPARISAEAKKWSSSEPSGQGHQHPVAQDQPLRMSGAGPAAAIAATTAAAQPALPRGGERLGQLSDEPVQMAARNAGEARMRQGRAGLLDRHKSADRPRHLDQIDTPRHIDRSVLILGSLR